MLLNTPRWDLSCVWGCPEVLSPSAPPSRLLQQRIREINEEIKRDLLCCWKSWKMEIRHSELETFFSSSTLPWLLK